MSLLIPAMQRKRANQESTPTVARWLTEFLVMILVKLSEVPGFSLRERDQRNRTLYPLVN